MELLIWITGFRGVIDNSQLLEKKLSNFAASAGKAANIGKL